MSRSEFFSRAVVRYLDELDAQSVIDQINRAVDAQSPDDDSSPSAIAVGRRVLASSPDEW